MLVHHFLEKSARSYPDKIAFVCDDTRETYGHINERANQLAHWLVNRGVEKGDRIPLLMENSLEYVISYYGTLKAGGVSVPLNADLSPVILNRLMGDLDPKALISSSRFEPLLKKADLGASSLDALLLGDPKESWPDCSFMTYSLEDLLGSGETRGPQIHIRDDDLASIVYTSGSTGESKGAMLTHGNITSNTNSICKYLELTEGDIQMVVLPFFYVMGKSLLNTHFASGGTVVINNQFAFTAAVLKQMEEEEVTGLSGVPSTFAYLLHKSPLLEYRDRLPKLRYCAQAGGHMPRQVKEELRAALPDHTKVYIMYGATEASARLTFLDPAHFLEKIDSIGKAIPGVTLKVLNKNGKELPAGKTGEIVATGPNIMKGYWRDPEATAGVLSERGYHTGDIGYKDDEGFLYTIGRKDSLLKVGGHRINPREIEDAILATGVVVETLVLGVPDRLLGNRLVALAVPKEKPASAEGILAHCARTLPRHKIPTGIHFVRSIPKKKSGKIDRQLCCNLLRRYEDKEVPARNEKS